MKSALLAGAGTQKKHAHLQNIATSPCVYPTTRVILMSNNPPFWKSSMGGCRTSWKTGHPLVDTLLLLVVVVTTLATHTRTREALFPCSSLYGLVEEEDFHSPFNRLPFIYVFVLMFIERIYYFYCCCYNTSSTLVNSTTTKITTKAKYYSAM